ncbi:hybrid sensor histidine kinase/response regulator [bacterium]|nr:MAG: hybrid sensor histidine kinase/response regulator [bacterium]
MKTPLPLDEEKRLEALRAYHILDTAPELAFDDIAELASVICGVPIAAVSLIDDDRQWFKAIVGLDAVELPREIAFCTHAILQPEEIMEVPDAREDPRFSGNVLVREEPHIRFYAGAPLVDPEGNPLGTVCVAAMEPGHLTPESRRALYALSRQVVSLLQLRRTLRNAEKQTEELRLAHIAAQAASRSKDNFLAGIGHELRTPLNGVVGLTETLLHDPLTDAQCETLALIDRSGRALMRVVDDLLQFGQPGDPVSQTHPTTFEPQNLAKEVADLYHPEARRKGLRLSALGPANLSISADSGLIRRVLTGLVDNAVKFTDRGSVRIEVLTILTDRIRFEITDSGIGFPEEEVAPFSPFEQGHRRERSGAGLGLESAQKIVQKLGGQMGRDPRPQGGTLSWFEVPVRTVEAAPEEARVREVSELRGKRALVVEDNPVNTLVIKTMMERLGITVDTAENGFEGVEAMARDGYDLILMDVQMPKMDGIEAARRIRLIEPNVPILAVTASSVEADRRACEDAGMKGYLVKPLTEATLLNQLASLLLS